MTHGARIIFLILPLLILRLLPDINLTLMIQTMINISYTSIDLRVKAFLR